MRRDKMGKYSIVSTKGDAQPFPMAVLYLGENLVVEGDVDELAMFRRARDVGGRRSKRGNIEALASQSQHGAIVLRIEVRR